MPKTKTKEKTEPEDNYLVPLDDYLKSGIHIGTKFENQSVKDFIYKTKPSGLKILDVQKVDERLRLGAKFLSQFDPQDILLVCRRETGHKAVKKLAEATGMRCIIGRYLPGTITNTQFSSFIEPKILFACDPWHDKQAVKDAVLCNIPIMALIGSNNSIESIDFPVPCNKKSRKSLPLIFYILAREYLKNKGIIKKDSDFKLKLEDFTDDEL